MFVAGIDAWATDPEGDRLLDEIEEAHGIEPVFKSNSQRRYNFGQFGSHDEAMEWLTSEASTRNPDWESSVLFGVASD